jgi:hypothetical protein
MLAITLFLSGAREQQTDWKEKSGDQCDFIILNVHQSRLLNQRSTNDQPMMRISSDKLPTKPSEWSLDDFYPCAFDQVVARFNHPINYRQLLECRNFFVRDGLRFRSSNNPSHARDLENITAPDERKPSKTVPAKQGNRRPDFAIRPLSPSPAQRKQRLHPHSQEPITNLLFMTRLCLNGIPQRIRIACWNIASPSCHNFLH